MDVLDLANRYLNPLRFALGSLTSPFARTPGGHSCFDVLVQSRWLTDLQVLFNLSVVHELLIGCSLLFEARLVLFIVVCVIIVCHDVPDVFLNLIAVGGE